MTTAQRVDFDLICPAGCLEEHDMVEVKREGYIRHILPAVMLEFPSEARGGVGDPIKVALNVHHWVWGDRPSETDICLDDDLPMFLDIDACQALAAAFQHAARKLAEVIADCEQTHS